MPLRSSTFEQVLAPLLEAMAGKVMVVHYRNIERAFLDQAVRRHLGEGFEFPVIDTMHWHGPTTSAKTWMVRPTYGALTTVHKAGG